LRHTAEHARQLLGSIGLVQELEAVPALFRENVAVA
jgi:hypothetical protein